MLGRKSFKSKKTKLQAMFALCVTKFLAPQNRLVALIAVENKTIEKFLEDFNFVF